MNKTYQECADACRAKAYELRQKVNQMFEATITNPIENPIEELPSRFWTFKIVAAHLLGFADACEQRVFEAKRQEEAMA